MLGRTFWLLNWINEQKQVFRHGSEIKILENHGNKKQELLLCFVGRETEMLQLEEGSPMIVGY